MHARVKLVAQLQALDYLQELEGLLRVDESVVGVVAALHHNPLAQVRQPHLDELLVGAAKGGLGHEQLRQFLLLVLLLRRAVFQKQQVG